MNLKIMVTESASYTDSGQHPSLFKKKIKIFNFQIISMFVFMFVKYSLHFYPEIGQNPKPHLTSVLIGFPTYPVKVQPRHKRLFNTSIKAQKFWRLDGILNQGIYKSLWIPCKSIFGRVI